jgi:hypothetical protein
MKTTANGTTAAKVNNNENKNRVNNIAMPAGEYGDLCYDYFGKGSVIVFGNTADHAAQLEAMGGKYSDRLRYSALQNGRKWTEKQGRTAGYYFTTDESKGEAVKYVQRVNHAIFDKYEQSTKGGEHLKQKPADFKAGDRVRTIHGLGTVTEHTPKYNAAQSVCVKLDKSTYNYGWKGMPQIFIECRCDEITRYTEAEKLEDTDTLTEEEKRDTLYRLWDAAWEKAQDEPKELRVIVETNEADPSAPKNEFGRYYMIDKADGCGNVYDRWQVIRVDIVKSPYEVHRPNYAAANGYADDQAQICIEVANKNNIVRWARRMIDAGRVTDIYADCY